MNKFWRILGITGVFALILVAIFTTKTKPSIQDQVWYQEMTIGSPEARNYFLVYTDLMCPYCVAFENAIIENEEKFNQYINEHDVLFEVKVTDFLYEYGESRPIASRYGAEALHCAKNENKFWDYYRVAISRLWNDYFKNGLKSDASNAATKDYFIGLGSEAGMSEQFSDCLRNDTTLEEVKSNTAKAAKNGITGMPYIKLNNYVAPGFDLSAGWDYVEMYFEAGLNSKK